MFEQRYAVKEVQVDALTVIPLIPTPCRPLRDYANEKQRDVLPKFNEE